MAREWLHKGLAQTCCANTSLWRDQWRQPQNVPSMANTSEFKADFARSPKVPNEPPRRPQAQT